MSAEAPQSLVYRGRPEDRLQRKIEQIWENEARNRFLADIARTIAYEGLAGLAARGFVTTKLDPAANIPENPWVAITVESPQHACALRQLLPDWELWQEVPGRARRQPGRSQARSRQTIVMMLAAQSADFDPDVIVVAHGGPGVPKWPNLPLGGSPRQVHIFDILDIGDQKMESEAHTRLLHYLNRSWSIIAPHRWLLRADPPDPVAHHRQAVSSQKPKTQSEKTSSLQGHPRHLPTNQT